MHNHYFYQSSRLYLDHFNEGVLRTIKNLRIKKIHLTKFNYKIVGKSHRGVNLTFDQDEQRVIIQNRIFSNEEDYILTNRLIKKLLFEAGGCVYDGVKDHCLDLPIYNIRQMKKWDDEDDGPQEISTWGDDVDSCKTS